MKSLSRENQADIIEAFNSTSRYLDDVLNIDNIYFDQMVDRIYPTELQLNRANSSDTEAPFLDLNLCISNGTVSTKMYDERDGFDLDIVSFRFLGGGVSRRASCGVCISRLVRFAGSSSGLGGFGCRGGALAAGCLGRGCRCFRLCEAFSKFCRRHSALVEGCSVGHRALLQRGVSEPKFCGDLVCGFGRVVGKSGFSGRFGELFDRCRGCGLDVVRRATCLVVGPVVDSGCASLFGCEAAVWASGLVAASSWGFDRWVGTWRCVFGLARRGSAVGFHLLWHAVGLAMSARLCLL